MARHRHFLHRYPFFLTLLPLLILAALTIYHAVITISPSYVDSALSNIFRPCLTRLPTPPEWAPLTPGSLTRIPVVGRPACCLTAFVATAASPHSHRAQAITNVILATVGGLLTTALLESARVGAARSAVIRRPMVPWLVSNLVGGFLVWHLVTIPAFLRQGERMGRRGEGSPDAPAGTPDETSALLRTTPPDNDPDSAPDPGKPGDTPDEQKIYAERLIPAVELYTIPLSVVAAYIVPSCFLLRTSAVPVVLAWIFFPVLVFVARSLVIRPLLKLALLRCSHGRRLIHPESHLWTLLLLYTIPLYWSVMSYFGLIMEVMFLLTEDRYLETRVAQGLVELDLFAILAAVAYWIFVEVGSCALVCGLVFGLLLGPGTGLCFAWIAREQEMVRIMLERDGEGGEEGSGQYQESEGV